MIASASIGGEIRIPGLSSRAIERIRLALTLSNPRYETASRFNQATSEPEFLCYVTEYPDGSITVPRGAIAETRLALEKEGHELRFTENQMHVGEDVFPGKLLQLWPHQQLSLNAVLRSYQGMIIIPCGGGKTFLGISIVGHTKKKSLIVVPSNDLLEQWRSACEQQLGLKCGWIRDGEMVDGPIVIALPISLANYLEKNPTACTSFGVFIADECHRCAASTYQKVLPFIPAKYRIGLTATPTREDGLTRVVDWMFGGKIHETTHQELIKSGHLMMPELEVVKTSFTFVWEGDDFDMRRFGALTKALTNDAERNGIIADIATRDSSAGQYVAVLTNSKSHCKVLAKEIAARGGDPVVLTGEDQTKQGKKFRTDTLQKMRDGKLRIIIATSLFDEGIDITRLSRVILALPQRAQGRTQQRVGRTMRVFYGKDPKVYDIVDPKVDTLVSRFANRRSVYREMGIL